MTKYIYRILLIYPILEIDGVNAFVKEYIDSDGGDWVLPFLSASGEDPATHGWTSFVATREQAELWLSRFADHLGGEVPQGLLDSPREQQRQWMQSASMWLFQASGIYFSVAFNDMGETVDPNNALEATGLKRIIQTI